MKAKVKIHEKKKKVFTDRRQYIERAHRPISKQQNAQLEGSAKLKIGNEKKGFIQNEVCNIN